MEPESGVRWRVVEVTASVTTPGIVAAVMDCGESVSKSPECFAVLTAHDSGLEILHVGLKRGNVVVVLDKGAGVGVIGLIRSLLIEVALDTTGVVPQSISLRVWWKIL